MIEDDQLDWAMAELWHMLPLHDGIPVRISGQDVERGTFSHRHAIIKTEDDETKSNTIKFTLKPPSTKI